MYGVELENYISVESYYHKEPIKRDYYAVKDFGVEKFKGLVKRLKIENSDHKYKITEYNKNIPMCTVELSFGDRIVPVNGFVEIKDAKHPSVLVDYFISCMPFLKSDSETIDGLQVRNEGGRLVVYDYESREQGLSLFEIHYWGQDRKSAHGLDTADEDYSLYSFSNRADLFRFIGERKIKKYESCNCAEVLMGTGYMNSLEINNNIVSMSLTNRLTVESFKQFITAELHIS